MFYHKITQNKHNFKINIRGFTNLKKPYGRPKMLSEYC